MLNLLRHKIYLSPVEATQTLPLVALFTTYDQVFMQFSASILNKSDPTDERDDEKETRVHLPPTRNL